MYYDRGGATLNRTHNFVVLTADQVLHGGDMLPVVLADLGRPLKGRLSVVPLASIFLDESVKAGVGLPLLWEFLRQPL